MKKNAFMIEGMKVWFIPPLTTEKSESKHFHKSDWKCRKIFYKKKYYILGILNAYHKKTTSKSDNEIKQWKENTVFSYFWIKKIV